MKGKIIMFRYFHNETLEIYDKYLDQYNIENDKDVFELLPPHIRKSLLWTEFDHVCEDLHYSLNFEMWLITFKGAIYG